ncbi:MAG: GNAT family N-acetyltransferase [Anaerolineales bacterium]
MKKIVEIADEHTMAVQAWLAARTPQAIQFQGIGTTVSSGKLLIDLSNLALGAHYPPTVADEEIDKEIHTVKHFFSERNVPWIWWLGPNTLPKNMLQRLAEHGLTGHSPLPAMALALPEKKKAINPNVIVWQAQNRADLEAASRIRRSIFELPPDATFSYFEDMATDWLRYNPARLYLARHKEGPPASIGALILGNGYPGVYVMTTLPEWEKKGLGSAILDCILREAKIDGHSMIFLTASEKGFPLYQKFGFEHLFDYQEVWEK